MNKLIFSVLLISVSYISNAQDIIYLRNKSEIKGKVIEIGTKEIKYKKYNFLNGPDYIVLKKQVDFIQYENGQKEFFFKNLSGEEYKHLCEKKVKHYVKQQKFGAGLAGAGTAAIILIGINDYNYNKTHPYNYEQQILYGTGYFFGSAAVVGGAVLYLTGKKFAAKYSEKLSKLSFGFNYSENLKGLTLVYKF